MARARARARVVVCVCARAHARQRACDLCMPVCVFVSVLWYEERERSVLRRQTSERIEESAGSGESRGLRRRPDDVSICEYACRASTRGVGTNNLKSTPTTDLPTPTRHAHAAARRRRHSRIRRGKHTHTRHICARREPCWARGFCAFAATPSRSVRLREVEPPPDTASSP